MKKIILISALALAGATATTANADTAYDRYGVQLTQPQQTAVYQQTQGGTAYERYGFGSTQTINQNFDTHGNFLNYKTNFALYNYKGETREGRYVKRHWEPKQDKVTVGPSTRSIENGKTVYNFNEYSQPMETSANFSSYNYLGDVDMGNNIVYRFWGFK